jgi:hypothetical protein
MIGTGWKSLRPDLAAPGSITYVVFRIGEAAGPGFAA